MKNNEKLLVAALVVVAVATGGLAWARHADRRAGPSRESRPTSSAGHQVGSSQNSQGGRQLTAAELKDGLKAEFQANKEQFKKKFQELAKKAQERIRKSRDENPRDKKGEPGNGKDKGRKPPQQPSGTFTPIDTPTGWPIENLYYAVTCQDKIYSPILQMPESYDGHVGDSYVYKTGDVLKEPGLWCFTGTCISKTDDIMQLQILVASWVGIDLTTILASANVDIDTALIPDEHSGQLRPITDFTPYDVSMYWKNWLNPTFDARLQPWVDALAANWSSVGPGLEAVMDTFGVAYGATSAEQARAFVDWLYEDIQRYIGDQISGTPLRPDFDGEYVVKLGSLKDMRRPAYFSGMDFASLEPDTYNVEFTVPASPTSEVMKAQTIAAQIYNEMMPTRYGELAPDFDACLAQATTGLGMEFDQAVLKCVAQVSPPPNDMDAFMDSCICAAKTPDGTCVGTPYTDAAGNPTNADSLHCVVKAQEIYQGEKLSPLHRIALFEPNWLEQCDSTDGANCPYGYRYPAPAAEIKLRGWFIKGQGDGADPCQIEAGDTPVSKGASCGKQHALVVWQQGTYSSALLNDPGNADAFQFRTQAYALAKKGYDVLLYDVMSMGYSEGYDQMYNFSHGGTVNHIYKFVPRPGPLAGDLAGMNYTYADSGKTVQEPTDNGDAVNLFYILKQLSNGTATIYNPHDAHASVPTSGIRLINRKDPVIIGGWSNGAFLAGREMAMYVGYDKKHPTKSDFPNATPPLDYSQFDLRGVIEVGGSDLKHFGERFGVLSYAGLGDNFRGGNPWNLLTSVEMATAKDWPAWIGFKGIYDNCGVNYDVDVYNQVRGIKKIVTVMGQHWDPLMGPYADATSKEMISFVNEVVRADKPVKDDRDQTTFEQAVCRAPYHDLTDPAFFPYANIDWGNW